MDFGFVTQCSDIVLKCVPPNPKRLFSLKEKVHYSFLGRETQSNVYWKKDGRVCEQLQLTSFNHKHANIIILNSTNTG